MAPLKFVFISPAILALLSSCSTPLEQCLTTANSEYYAISSGIAESERNVTRGYAVHSQTVPYTYTGSCYDYYIGSYSCPQTGYRTQETPVAIDVNEERRKLSSLRKMLPAASTRANAAAEQCRATYPAS